MRVRARGERRGSLNPRSAAAERGETGFERQRPGDAIRFARVSSAMSSCRTWNAAARMLSTIASPVVIDQHVSMRSRSSGGIARRRAPRTRGRARQAGRAAAEATRAPGAGRGASRMPTAAQYRVNDLQPAIDVAADEQQFGGFAQPFDCAWRRARRLAASR